jgi:hypothetical protein
MQPGSTDEQPRIPALPLVFASVGFTGIGLFSWEIVVFTSTFEGRGTALWLLLFAVLAGPAGGSAVAYSSRRWWPFFAGVAVALVPIALAALLLASGPAGPVVTD